MAEARILHVNVDAEQRGSWSQLLARAGFDVIEAATGREALEKIGSAPDLVIVGMQLPDLDGLEVVRHIRANPATRLIPVLHLSDDAVKVPPRVRELEGDGDGYLALSIAPDDLVATVRAVLRARQAERELRQSLARSSIILQNIADAVTAQDASGRVVYANDAALRLLGYATHEELERDASMSRLADYELLDDDGAPFPPESLPGRLVLAGAPAAEATIRWRRRDSPHDRWTVVQSRPVKDETGRVTMAINILHDTTEQRRAERRMMLLTEASAILTSLIDFDEMLQQLARLPVPRLCDWCVLDVIDRDRVRRFVVHGDAAQAERVAQLTERPPAIADTMRMARAELIVCLEDDELRRRARDEETFALARALGARSLVMAPLAARGHTLGTLSLVSASAGRFGEDDLRLAQDLAHSAALAVDNARVFREAQQAAEVRKELVAVVAHDLKNPLNAIGMAAAMVAKHAGTGPGAERILRQTSVVARAAERMNRLIHDLLDVAAIDAGALSMEHQRMNVNLLLNEALELMAGLAQDKQLSLERELPATDLHVTGDRERLLQVFSNLIGNAIKLTPAGGRITFGAARHDMSVQFYVADSGPGIAPEHVAHLFDRFWRVRRQRPDGTGLGLSIVKGIVEAHGGTVAVDTSVTCGARFYFTLIGRIFSRRARRYDACGIPENRHGQPSPRSWGCETYQRGGDDCPDESLSRLRERSRAQCPGSRSTSWAARPGRVSACAW